MLAVGCGIQLSRAVYSSCVLELLNLHLKKKQTKPQPKLLLLCLCAEETERERFSLWQSSRSVRACDAEMGLSGGGGCRGSGNSVV